MPAPFLQRSLVGACLVLSCSVVVAQRPGPKGSAGPASTMPIPGADVTTRRPIYVTGRVLIEGGLAPTEPIAIERFCNGGLRREGYTDNKGHFQLQLGYVTEQDVSENDSATGNPQMMKTSGASHATQFEGCELRALLTGFRSSSVVLHILQDDFGEIQVGTIFLTRMDTAEGTSISVTSLAAPKEARQAYEKGKKAAAEKRYEEAARELDQAVKAYPKYSAAWYLLGEIHRPQQPDQAAKEYAQAIAADPQFVNPYFGLALVAVDQKKWPDVQHSTDQVIRLNASAFPLAYFYNAAANYNLGQLDAAEQSARKFQTLDPDHHKPEICLILASVLEAKQDHAGAARQLRDYVALVPGSPMAGQLTADAQRLENISPAAPK